MEYYWYVCVFLLGAIIGSFLNVVIYRLHTGKSANGRSHCLSCGGVLRWFELVPLISYLALRGSCRRCASHIPLRYFLVELLTAGMFVFLFHLFRYDLILFGLNAVIASILIVIAVYDLRHMVIPDETVVALSGVALVTLLYLSQFYIAPLSFLGAHILAGLAGAAFFAFFWIVSKGRWMGLGDAKLALPLCVLLGPWGTLSAIVFAFWIGAGISLALIIVQAVLRAGKTHLIFLPTTLRMKSEVPFAPFLILGFLSVHLFHVNIITLNLLTF